GLRVSAARERVALGVDDPQVGRARVQHDGEGLGCRRDTVEGGEREGYGMRGGRRTGGAERDVAEVEVIVVVDERLARGAARLGGVRARLHQVLAPRARPAWCGSRVRSRTTNAIRRRLTSSSWRAGWGPCARASARRPRRPPRPPPPEAERSSYLRAH